MPSRRPPPPPNPPRELSVYRPRGRARRVIKVLLVLCVLATGLWVWTLDPDNVNVRALRLNDPDRLWVHAPSTVQAGEAVPLTVECWDYCERLVCGYDGTVEFNATDPRAQLPAPYTFRPSWWNQGVVEATRFLTGDGGLHRFQVVFETPGIHYVHVTDPDHGYVARSNPVLVTADAPALQLYWGDIHGHQSITCDGSGYPEEVLAYAEDVACLDFATFTQHDHFISPMHSGLGWEPLWARSKQVLNAWNAHPDFTTLLAYEYRGGFLTNNRLGDLVIYSRGDDVPYFSGAMKAWETPDLLFAALGEWEATTGTEVMTIPHHPPHAGWAGMTFDWSYFDPAFIRLVEIYSIHGSSDCRRALGNPYPLAMRAGEETRVVDIDKPGYYVQDALAMGYQVGFMAAGDSHDGHLGHSLSHTEANHLLQQPYSWGALPHLFRVSHAYPNGLTGVWAASNARPTIYDALWNRACYAIKGVGRPLLNFTVNGRGVGTNASELRVAATTTPRHVALEAHAGAGTPGNLIERVEIIKNNQLWQNVTVQARDFHGAWVDAIPVTGLAYNASHGEVRDDGRYYATEIADNPVDPATLNTGGADVYYARVFETEGGAAWVGPLWVAA